MFILISLAIGITPVKFKYVYVDSWVNYDNEISFKKKVKNSYIDKLFKFISSAVGPTPVKI